MADRMPVDDDMPPPLEDMSNMLKQLNKIKEIKHKKQQTNGKPQPQKQREKQPKLTTPEVVQSPVGNKTPYTTNSSISTEEKANPKPAAAKSNGNKADFGGMKKGFLFGGGAPKKATQKIEDDIPFIKPKSSRDEEYQLPEVQQAMQAAQAFQENKDWITQDLLTKIMTNPTLGKRLTDPAFMSAVTEFQTNPTAAMAKYQDNPEMTKFLKDFCGLMGEHFSKLAEQQDGQTAPQRAESRPVVTTDSTAADLRVHSSTNPKQATAQDEERIQQIISDPTIRDILMKPEIQTVFQKLRTDPDKAQRSGTRPTWLFTPTYSESTSTESLQFTLREAKGDLQKDIRKLVDAGLLQFQR